MTLFLSTFSAGLAPDEHAVMVLDGAGWHTSLDLAVPENVSLLRLPPYSPELNSVERVWLYLRERHLSHRLHADNPAILDAACAAWRKLTPERLRSLCDYAWLNGSTHRLGDISSRPQSLIEPVRSLKIDSRLRQGPEAAPAQTAGHEFGAPASYHPSPETAQRSGNSIYRP